MEALKYLSNFLRTVEMSLINCEVRLILSWSEKYVIVSNTDANQATTFAITDTKLYVTFVALSTQDDAKLLQQSKSGFKMTIDWNKYQPKVVIQAPNPYLDYLTDPSFQGVNRLFVLSIKNATYRTVHTKYHLPTVEMKDYNIIIDGQNFSY